MALKYIAAIFLLVQLIQVAQISADFYTSVSSLEEILYTEVKLLDEFEEYFNKVKSTNEKLKKFLDGVEKNITEINKNPAEYYNYACNTFKVLKHFVVDWNGMKKTVLNDAAATMLAKNITQMDKDKFAKASQADLVGASSGLARLQSTYGLSAGDISDGILLGNEYDSELNAHDCFEIGRTLYDAKNFKFAAEWLIRARTLLAFELEEAKREKKENDFRFRLVNDTRILGFLAPSMFNIGNWKMAVVFNDELLAKDPKHVHGLGNKKLFEKKLLEQRREHLQMDNEKSAVTAKPQKSKVFELYESVCRGTVRQTPREQRNLRCRYTTKDVPFCLIAPFKMEELNHDPFVALYYDAIYDHEITQIIESSEDNIQRSKVGNRTISDSRTSQNAWLYYHQHDFLKPIRQRLIDITGLSMKTAEPLQVANYGIGGHYAPHYDFTEFPDEKYPGLGNRILTALFYINEVELGGATAFPFLHIAVPPKRGNLLVWFNMHESLELDYRTRHAACPVLKGSKWVCNEWFHQVGQEFIRPCSLERNGHISLPYKSMTN